MHNPYRNKDIGEASICVFCGSSNGVDPDFIQAATFLGQEVGRRGFRLIFGAGNVGLMGQVARAARDAGAPVIGVLPQYLRHVEPPLHAIQEVIITPNIQERKQRMLALSDAFVLLPGGLGTLDEFFEVLTEAQLHVHNKPIIVINLKGYYEPLRAMLTHVIAKGFARDEVLSHFRFADTVEEALDMVEAMLTANARLRPA
ncbi:MAG TPA: TIGR00730 family Rossman fold protein [Rhizomicrobium sp.]|nr:TIGR00730 family Rossman fold protein [Rhizomicrobium sp.]